MGEALPRGEFAALPNGRQIHFHSLGPVDGAVVVFIHGSGPGASGWGNFHENGHKLAQAGYRVLLPDSIGYGHSSKPEDVEYTLDFFVDHLLGFLDVIGVAQCALVGNSMGGAMAIRAALRDPDRVARLVLMAPGGLEEREIYMQMRGIRRMLRAIYGPEGLTEAGMHKVFELQCHDSNLVQHEVIAQRFEVAQTQPLTVFKTMQIPNLSGELDQLQCPVLGFWGANDLFCPVSGATILAKGCSRAQVMVLSECGHWVMVERPDVFDQLTADFLGAWTQR